ncbi:MAG TPA: hypothetical protein VHG89_04585 [Verrucomicrobiae bacterium]|nr:hypothetical protein [Verrucomicrobiae bacterium]
MHIALHIFIFWGLAFVSLGLAILLLNIFWNLIEQDLDLKDLTREAIIAGVASMIEAVGLVLLIPLGAKGLQAMLVPFLIVGLIYKISHLEDWSHYEIICLLLFQLIIVAVGVNLFLGNFAAAFGILIVFAIVLAIIVAFIRGL